MTFDEWYSAEAPPENFGCRSAQLSMAKSAWNAAIREATKVVQSEFDEEDILKLLSGDEREPNK